MYLYKKRGIIRNWLMPLWRLTSSKSAEWASRLETQKSQYPSPRPRLRNSAGEFPLAQSPCSNQTFQLMGCSPPTFWGHLLSSESTNVNAMLIQKGPHRNSHNNVWPNIWAPCAPSCHIKLTITPNIADFWCMVQWLDLILCFLY